MAQSSVGDIDPVGAPQTVVRAAQPTFDEGLEFARYLNEAADGFFGLMLGGRVADIVATAYTRPDHDLSYQNAVFAERDHGIVGMASGYTAEMHHGASDDPLKQAAGNSVYRLMAVSLIFSPLLRFLDTHADGDFYLQSIAVDSNARGGGVGSALLDGLEARAHATGAARLCLDVSAKNEGARRLYERRGMTTEAAWPNLPVAPPIVVRMSKQL